MIDDKVIEHYWNTYEIDHIEPAITTETLDACINRLRLQYEGKEFFFRRLNQNVKIQSFKIYMGNEIKRAEKQYNVSCLFLFGGFMYETNRGYFTGDVPPEKCNPAGIKAFTSDPDKAQTFRDWFEGFGYYAMKIRAQYLNPTQFQYRQIVESGLKPNTVEGIYSLWSTAPKEHDINVAKYMAEYMSYKTDFSQCPYGRIIPIMKKFMFDTIVVHHSVTDQFETTVEAIRRYHIEKRHFTDIGYHFVITGDGYIHEGRSINKMGANVIGHNKHTLGICLTGDFRKDEPTKEQLNSLIILCKTINQKYGEKKICGHRDLQATVCPGNKLYSKLDYIREEVKK
jgi:hypothetical protein